MNIHADDIGLSIVVPGSSYTLWLYATYCYCICGFYTVRARARQRLITEYYSAGAVQGDYWKFKYENAGPAKTSIMFHQPITR